MGPFSKQAAGLFGPAANGDPRWWQYLDQIILGGDIQATQQAARQRQAAEEVAGAYQPQTAFGQGPATPSTGSTLAPRATEQDGMLTRQLQEDPALQGAPTVETRRPDMGVFGPILAKAAAAGVSIAPFLNINQQVAGEEAAKEPKIVNTGQSVQSYDPTTRQMSQLYADPVRGPTAPAGYRFNGGNLEPIPGGPADLATIQQVGTTRRKVVTGNPMPSRPRASGGSAGGQPWKNGWRP